MELKAKEYLSSYEFYAWIQNIRGQLLFQNDEQVVLDFTEVIRIEAPVIPNLLCLGQILKTNTLSRPILRLAESLTGGHLKKYLNDINFLQYATEYKLFEFENSPYGGWDGKQMDSRNTTIYFPLPDVRGLTVEEIKALVSNEYYTRVRMGLAAFIKYYLATFDVEKIQVNTDKSGNSIFELICEMTINSAAHGRSFSFATMQANYSAKKIFISISDCGGGFKKSVAQNINDGRIDSNILSRIPVNEFEAIIVGLYARVYEDDYGLYSVAQKVLKLGGTMRIHSNDTQVVLTPAYETAFNERILLSDKSFAKKNVRRNLVFGGAHIEIDLPIEIKDRRGKNAGAIHNW